MSDYMMATIGPADVPEAAEFIVRSATTLRREDGFDAYLSGEDVSQMRQGLQSRLFENPFCRADIPPGLVLKNDQGAIVGTLMTYPWRYLLGERSLLGLAASVFFVDPAARMQGFFMFRRYLNTTGVDFWYANTCNARSGAIWQKSGGIVVPESGIEYMVVFHVGPVAEELALRRGASKAVRRIYRIAGALARPLTWQRRSGLALARETDWQRMAVIADKDRDPAILTCHRSDAYLRWTYESALKQGAVEIYRFEDTHGNAGWFSLNRARRGKANQIRGVKLLDVVWPRDRIDFRNVLRAIIEKARVNSDLLSIRPRPGMALEPRRVAVIRRSLPAPEAFVLVRAKGGPDLSRIIDLAAADAV